jgi:hypothetical protein
MEKHLPQKLKEVPIMLIVEKIEDGIVTVENENIHFNISISQIIGNVKENDVLIEDGDFYIPDKALTEIRRNKIKDMQNSLFE